MGETGSNKPPQDEDRLALANLGRMVTEMMTASQNAVEASTRYNDHAERIDSEVYAEGLDRNLSPTDIKLNQAAARDKSKKLTKYKGQHAWWCLEVGRLSNLIVGTEASFRLRDTLVRRIQERPANDRPMAQALHRMHSNPSQFRPSTEISPEDVAGYAGLR